MRQHRWSSTPASRGAQCLRWRCPRFAAAWQAAASDVAAPLPLASARVLAAHLPGSARRRCRPLLPRIRHPRRSQRLCERSRPAAACGCLCHQQRVWYGGSAGGAPRSIACLPACLLALLCDLTALHVGGPAGAGPPLLPAPRPPLHHPRPRESPGSSRLVSAHMLPYACAAAGPRGVPPLPPAAAREPLWLPHLTQRCLLCPPRPALQALAAFSPPTLPASAAANTLQHHQRGGPGCPARLGPAVADAAARAQAHCCQLRRHVMLLERKKERKRANFYAPGPLAGAMRRSLAPQPASGPALTCRHHACPACPPAPYLPAAAGGDGHGGDFRARL